jgi:hypothetical protein
MIDSALAKRLDEALNRDLDKEGRLGKPRRYLSGDHDLPYMPKGARAEYKHLGRRAITNWTPLISDTYAKGLFVDGYRESRASDNAEPWSYWQANGLDARQTVAHRGALEYGASYTLVLPGTLASRRVPTIRPLSPLRTAAWYQDEDDEYPELFLRRRGVTSDGTRLIELMDRNEVVTFAQLKDSDKWIESARDEHGLGVTPVVRFRDRIDGEAVGIIRPIINIQDRVNEIVFSTLMALQYAVFRQRWATGLAIPMRPVLDEHGEPTGEEEPYEPFEAAVDRLWVAEDDTVRFGDFAQTETSGHQTAYESTVRSLAAISQISPNILTGDLVNLSADALAQMEASTQRKISEYETLFGESWETVFRLSAVAAGRTPDDSAQVRWRDTEARSLSQTVDALGKMAQMLSVPVEELWEKIPGITDTDVLRWKTARASDPLAEIAASITRQTAPNTATTAE